MKEQLIEFQTAKLAKKRGFIDYTFNGYNKKAVLVDREDIYDGSEFLLDWNTATCMIEGEHYAAPTQSLLQKWLREKYNIHISVELLKDDMWGSTVYSDLYEYKDLTETYDQTWKTFEAALEEGLQEALKLIKL